MFEVTYVNEHTCHVLRAIANGDAARMAASPRTTNPYRDLGVVDTARDDGGGVLFDDLSSSFPHIGGGGGSAQENETIVSCLADVIRGAAPSPLPSPWPPAAEAGARDPAAASYVPPPMQASAGHSASVGVAEDGGAMTTTTTTMIDDTDFCWDPSSFCAVGEADQDQLMMDHRDMHVDVARLADTVWPRHTSAGAWR